MVIHVCKEAHDKLAVHSVGHTAVAGNGVAKVLDLEGSLKARSKKATKGSDQGGKCCEGKGMKLDWGKSDGEGSIPREEEKLGKLVGLGEEDRVRSALQTCKDVRAEILP